MAGLEELSKKPPAVLALLFVGAAGLLGVAYWQVFWTPEDEARAAARAQTTQLQNEHQELKKQKEKWEELTLQKEQIGKILEENQVSLPEAAELPAFFGHMQKQMAASGVELLKWGRGKEKPIDAYIKVPVKIQLEGSFYELTKYFYLLYQTDRIITVENLSLTPQRSGADPNKLGLTAEFVASTFRQKAGKGGAKRKAKRKVKKGKAAKAVEAANNRSAKALGDGGAAKTPASKGNATKGVNRLKGQ